MRRYLIEENLDIIQLQLSYLPINSGNYRKKWISVVNTCPYAWSIFHEEKLLSDIIHKMVQVERALEIPSERSYSWYGCNHRGLLLT